MGIFKKKKDGAKANKVRKTQVDIAIEALERGEVLDMMKMLFDYGIGNHTGCIAKCRKRYEREGKGYDYIKTRMVATTSRKTGVTIRYAKYYIEK